MGLTYAGVYLLHVRNVPDQFKEEFEQIKAALLATPLGTETGYERYATDPEYRASLVTGKTWEKAKRK